MIKEVLFGWKKDTLLEEYTGNVTIDLIGRWHG